MSLSSPESPVPPARQIYISRVENPSDEHEELNKMAHDVVAESQSNEVFSTYVCCSLKQDSIQKHPGDIVEAGCLAAQKLPENSYGLFDAIPADTVETGKLSDLQLEGIMYACQRHQVVLPNGQRSGFFIGDGAGVGKGRQIAGIILDNYARGRCKHIWFSISTDLCLDAQRDLNDIGCYIKVIGGCQQLDKETRVFGLPPDFKEGVVFSTYATLVSSVQKTGSRQSRLQQLMDWCGGTSFDGCVIFDECHKAKHFVPGKEETSTKVAVAVTSLQRMLPKARVVYCSATGVTDVKNMAFMERLGLWGDGTPFKSFGAFLESITKRGLGAAEMLAMEMKACGIYVSRGLSFRQAEFVNIEAPLTKEQVKVYDTAVHVWSEIKKSLEFALARTSPNPRIWTLFWSSHQRFFKQLCMSMKVSAIVKEATEALESGLCVVIGLQTTGEASLESVLSRCGGNVSRFISLTEEIMTRFITQYFPTTVEKTKGDVVEDKWSAQAKTLLLGFVKKIGLPISPLDQIIDQLGGPERVAEMTGRHGRIVTSHKQQKPHYETRESDNRSVEGLNVQERNSFMSGQKLVAIISDAASTGISLHSDLRVTNQRQRVHVTMELPWSADKAVQQLGRSHRSNQSSGPIYKLVTTNLGGERRFAAAVARRLQSLGALTKGDRRAATGADLTQFNFDTPYGRSALKNMYQAITTQCIYCGVTLSKILSTAQVPEKYEFLEFNNIMRECLVSMGITDESYVIKDKDARDVSRFLNRILGLSVERQNMIFTYFTECLLSTTEAAKREGRFNEGVTDVSGSSITMIGQPTPVFTDIKRGLMTTKLVELNVDRGVSWEAAVERIDKCGQHELDGFYISKREHQGRRRLYLLAIRKETSTHLFNIIRPNTGLSPFEEKKMDLLHKYTKVEADEAQSGWREQYERTEELCIHGPKCKSGASCRVGCRVTPMHLLCGGIVPLLSTLETVMMKNSDRLGLARGSRTLRVVRVELDDGQRLVGLRYPESLIGEVSSLLKEQKTLDSLLAKQSGVAAMESAAVRQEKEKCEAVVEAETAVNPKTLSKALAPPVTIRNFFKPKSEKEPSPHHDEEPASAACNGTITQDDEPIVILEQNSASEKDSSPGSKIQGPFLNFNSKEPIESKNSHTVAARSSVTKSNSSKSSCSKSRLGVSLSSKGRPSVKRAGPRTEGSSSKRQKQASLAASFAKGSSAKPSVEKQLCPICRKSFPQGTGNAEVNQHIDNCLIG